MKCTHVCVAQKAYKLFAKLWIKPNFPSLADEIAEPRPYMNIKVAMDYVLDSLEFLFLHDDLLILLS